MMDKATSVILQTIDDFATIMRSLPTTINTLNDELARYQDAIRDIDHWLELNDFPSKIGSKRAKEIKKIRQKRREVKDRLLVLTPLAAYIQDHVKAINALDKVRGEMSKHIAYVNGNRTYRPRVMYELFGETPPQNAMRKAMEKAKGEG